MEYKVGDIVRLKGTHPCGSNIWEILRVGMDFRLKCCKCHHMIMLSRLKFEKAIETEPDLDSKNILVQNGCYMQNTQNSSIKQQKPAIDNTVANIQFIDKPNNEIISYAISKDPSKVNEIAFKKTDDNFVKNIDDSKLKSENSIKKVMDFFESQENKIKEQDCVSSIISSEDAINTYLNIFAERFEAKKCFIASGFIYKSGLQMISPLFSKVYGNQGELEIVAGSLKDYFRSTIDNKLVNMDINTAKYLNMMISEHGCNVYTKENKFYHGKYYFIEGESISCCMIGSSNLTASGFTGNYELNTFYFMKNNSEQYKEFNTWFQDFLKKCIKIDVLSESNFTDTNLTFDTINAGSTVVSVDVNTIENEVQRLTDEDVKFRLSLWLNKKPTNIYRKLDIEYLKDYVAFEFKDYNLIVFESFVSGNGYYYFESNNIFETIEKIKQLRKTEIFQMSDMNKRGYHVKDANMLVKKINSLFRIRRENI